MTGSFRRTPDFDRRTDMVEATLDCIADLSIQGTTVRAVAVRAGVSNGLIRHHFTSKDNLIIAAYRRTIEMMTRSALAVFESDQGTPHDKLNRFIVASLGGPVADPRMLSLWATFISQVRHNPDLAREHRDGYLAYRRATEPGSTAISSPRACWKNTMSRSCQAPLSARPQNISSGSA